MKEEIEKLAEEYVDKCPKRYGFVIRSDAMKNNFIDLFVAGYNSCLEKQKKRILELETENAKLERENEALCNRILSLQEGFEKEFDLQNKRIDKLKDELKKIRVAYIYAQVGNVIAGTDIDSLLEKMFGKKENVVIWHDLRENPDDLPDCSHGHTVFNQDLDRVIIRDGRFEYTDGGKAEVIAWCEISNDGNLNACFIFHGWHDERYLVQCLSNLQEKYDCGAISKQEWKVIVDNVIRCRWRLSDIFLR